MMSANMTPDEVRGWVMLARAGKLAAYLVAGERLYERALATAAKVAKEEREGR
ncbi:MAG: hypothetical protein ACKVT1_02445 [Dehalococcoidia bacterium]